MINSNSLFEYPESFGKDERSVKLTGEAFFEVSKDKNRLAGEAFFEVSKDKNRLTGEAFFEVSKDKNRPFRVRTDQVTTTVLGTRFNINSSTGGVKISLVEGSVSARGLGYTKLLRPDQQACFDLNSQTISVKNFDSQIILAWKEGEFDFKDITLKKAASILEEKFKVSILFEHDKLESKRITGHFSGESLKAILIALTKTTDLNFKKISENQILIY